MCEIVSVGGRCPAEILTRRLRQQVAASFHNTRCPQRPRPHFGMYLIFVVPYVDLVNEMPLSELADKLEWMDSDSSEL